ncbi:type VI secretion system baseplate subunit TssF, partial [Pseudomonas aeruginosa]|uniref:type VI secretion system baseplate subunit TssF n=1 Tax=Pseudomonas aeruginosa TaxID=287 RepID=UPI0039697400
MSDSIDADLLDYYQRELTWLRHAGGAFAERYPKVARRLQLAPGECPDPHVERLLEGFSLLTARLQRRRAAQGAPEGPGDLRRAQ